jgi:hypothetical protein
MDIDAKTGRILIFMVQQDGPWGTPEGDLMIPTLEKLAGDIVSHPTHRTAATRYG